MSWFDLQIQEVWSRLGQNRVWFDAGTALRQPEGTSGLLTNTSSSPLTSDARFGHQLPTRAFLFFTSCEVAAGTHLLDKGRGGTGSWRHLPDV